jgi:integrase/recombinase XerD
VSTPLITIFVRHSPGCKWAGEEFHKGCRCRKHLRWSNPEISWVDKRGARHQGKQYRKAAGTRSWEQAEQEKRKLEAQLSGVPLPENQGKTIAAALELFKADKLNQGLTPGVLDKYERELGRLHTWAENRGVFTVASLTRELLIAYQATWPALYPSTQTRQSVQTRLRTFLRFCFDNRWLDRVPKTSRIKIEEAPTMPLTAKEYDRLLRTIPKTFTDSAKAARVRALIQLMRWSGLSIRDAVTLRRDEIIRDKAAGLYRIVTARQKTGTHVSVPIPADVAHEILAVGNGNPVYLLWSGNGKEANVCINWQHSIHRLFEDAGIEAAGNMRSHRLRDTFAVDMLSKDVPLEDVSKMLGHTSVKTTEKHYSPWVKGRQDRLDKLVTGTWTK